MSADFVRVENSRKVACAVCGVRGYDGWPRRYGWQRMHLRPHLPCPDCGRMFPVKIDGSARVHTRCSQRSQPVPDDAKEAL